MAGNVQSKSFSRGKSSSLKGFLDKLLQRKNSADVPSPGPSTTTDNGMTDAVSMTSRVPHTLCRTTKRRLIDTIKPPNCHFQIANVLDGLPFPDNTFDYVNQRMLTFAIKENEWPSLITEILRVTKPNGWVEFLEFDLQSYNRGPLNTEGLKPTFYAFKSRGINPYIARKLDRFLVKAGVVNVAKDWVSIPLNWGGRLGQLFYDDVREVLISFRPYLTKVTGLSNEEYDAKIKASLEECKEYKTYNNFYAAWGQAPDESAEKV
ncbi:hypothetical protein BC938DRAFT_472734 [Jimgerdemannia flammicorona]|uniref:Methyltransferase domain-containing protein n=1 Tax=Jimgerdemannia flammicorona TaxID=994334 RepID=A0A433Q5H4_9FUNG|nr:hypothetical protein BC938DRAFT_472734 [Jimgerdemannia flammicorona]